MQLNEDLIFFFKQETAYGIEVCREFRRVLFRSAPTASLLGHTTTIRVLAGYSLAGETQSPGLIRLFSVAGKTPPAAVDLA